MSKLTQLLAEWNDPLGARTMSDAEDLIHELQVELAGKESVVKTAQDDKRFYRDAWHRLSLGVSNKPPA